MGARHIVINIICLFIMPTTAHAEFDINKKLAKYVTVNWNSIKHNKTVALNNPAVNQSGPVRDILEDLILYCEIDTKDPNTILGTCERGIVTELTDTNGQKINFNQKSPQSNQMDYRDFRYQRRYEQPTKLSKIKRKILSFFRHSQGSGARLINELVPNRMEIELDIALLEKTGGEIKSLKGYFHALSAESLEYIDVPFEPNSNWENLTPDIQIRVYEARCRESTSRLSYNFDIEERRLKGDRLHRFTIDDKIPDRIVVDRQLIDKNGKVIDRTHSFRLPANVGGRGSGTHSGSLNISSIEKFRFVIAVNVKQQKIPFEFRNIPIPDSTKNKTD